MAEPGLKRRRMNSAVNPTGEMYRSHQDMTPKFGVGLMLSRKPLVQVESFTAVLTAFANRIGASLGATVRVGIHGDHDPFEDGVWGRCQDARIDGVVDLRLDAPQAPDSLLRTLAEAKAGLDDVIVRGRSTVVVGDAFLLVDKSPSSPFAVVCGTRRNRAIDQAALRKWWLEEHSVWMFPYFEKSCQRFEAILADTRLTRLVALALGFGGALYDFYEYHTFNAWEEFAGAIDVEANSLALKDEAGHLECDAGMRVGWVAEL